MTVCLRVILLSVYITRAIWLTGGANMEAARIVLGSNHSSLVGEWFVGDCHAAPVYVELGIAVETGFWAFDILLLRNRTLGLLHCLQESNNYN